MKIIRKKLTKSEFSGYLKTKTFGTIRPSEIVLHHTWKPTLETWNGEKTIDGLKNYYESLGWPAGPHIFVAPDGIWLFTDINEVGIHAGAGNAVWGKNGKEYSGYSVYGGKLKKYSVGVEIVGNYDEKVWEGDVLQNSLACLSSLKKNLDISNESIKFHRDFSPKTCPGNAITKEWVEKKLADYDEGIIPTSGYEFKFSAAEAKKAQELGLLKQIDTETREIIAIGLVRVYEKIKEDFGKKT